MKKVLFFISIAVLLVALAMVGSATTYYTDGTTEYFECEIANTYHIDSYVIKNGGFPKYDSDGDALTWYLVSTETDSETGDIIKTVASVKTKNYHNNGTYSAPLTKYNVVSANFDAGTSKIPVYGGMDGGQSKEILFIYVPDAVTTLDFRFCQLASVVKCEFSENSQCSSWAGLTFWGAKSLREIHIPKLMTKFPTKDGGAFDGCSRLSVLTFDENALMTTIEGWYFDETSIESLILPNTVTTITPRIFQGMKQLKYVKFGNNVQAIENTQSNNDHFSLFHDCSNLETVVIPGTLLAENIGTNGRRLTYAFSTGSPTFVYTGTLEEFKKIQAVFSNHQNNGALTGATVENGRIVIANHCEVYFDGKHDTDDGKCETAMEAPCTRCQRQLDAKEHKIIVNTLKYPNGFVCEGVRNYLCENEGCYFYDKVNEATAPIFAINEFVGFSDDGEDGIAFGGYQLNAKMLDEYNELNPDEKLNYGVVLINPAYVYGKEAFFVNGKVNADEGFIQTDMSSARYANISISITGFTGKAQNLSIILAIYAYTDIDNVEFIQSQTTKCADKNVTLGTQTLYTVTFASVVAGDSSLSNLGDYIPPSKEENQ